MNLNIFCHAISYTEPPNRIVRSTCAVVEMVLSTLAHTITDATASNIHRTRKNQTDDGKTSR